MPLVDEREELRSAQILERMTEPDRIVIFRVTWQDDQGKPARQPRLARSVQQLARALARCSPD